MIILAGYSGRIIKGDTIIDRVYTKLAASEKDLIDLLCRTYNTIAISFNG